MNCILLLVLQLLWIFTEASHFRGAITAWRIQENYGNGTLLLKITTARHFKSGSGSGTFQCYNSLSQNSISWSTTSNVSHRDNSSYDDWSTTQTDNYLLESVGSSCMMKSTSSSWISGLYFSVSSWSIPIFIDLRSRIDTGDINSPPVAIQQPVIRFVAGCPDSVLIPMRDDDDGDVTTCRYGNGTDEAGDVTNIYPYFSNNPYSSSTGECQISYNGGGSVAKVAVVLIVEDHPPSDTLTVLSFNSVQFIIDVVSPPSGHVCGEKPLFVTPTPPNNQETVIQVGSTWQTKLRAKGAKSSSSIVHFGIFSTSNISKSNIVNLFNGQYEVNISWTPTETDRGSHYVCFAARDSSGLISKQSCITLIVGEISQCKLNNGGCSDLCIHTGSSYVCACSRDCWELGSDQRQCIPIMNSSCSNSRMTIAVEKCAVDNFISLASYDPAYPTFIPAECRNESTGTHHVFNFSMTECGTTTNELLNQVNHNNKVKLWIDDSDNSSVIDRGHWYYIDLFCSTEKYLNVSGSFEPVDTSVTTSVIIEDGFSDITVAFDFYRDESFQNTYSPYDYPLTFNISDDVYFGILANSADEDVELFTESCTSKPDPDPGLSQYHEIITSGCPIDTTLQAYYSNNPMMNKFSVEAFKFKDNLPGINDNTNVRIQCQVVVCVSGIPGTTCSRGCVSSVSKRSVDFLVIRKRRVIFRQTSADDDDDDDIVPVRNTSVSQTRSDPSVTSGFIRVLAGPAGGGGDESPPAATPATVITTTTSSSAKPVWLLPQLVLIIVCGWILWK